MFRTLHYTVATYVSSSLVILAAVAWYANAPIAYEVAALDDFDEMAQDEQIAEPVMAAPEPQAPKEVEQKITVRWHMPLDEPLKHPASLSNAVYYAQAEQPSVRHASLPPAAASPAVEPKKVQVAWTATLEERQGIAKNYLERNCPAILTLEKMQSEASKKDTDARFMKAQSPGAIVGAVKGQLRGHPIVVGQFCPTEFYNQLFAKK